MLHKLQFCPLYNLGHAQLYFPVLSTLQVPQFKHGLLKQAFVSKKNDVKFNKFIIF